MLLAEVEKTIQKYGLLHTNDRVVVAVSGGPDSVALLYLLNALKKKWQLYLHVAHFNHDLRHPQADEDSVFVSDLSAKLKLTCTTEKQNVGEFAKNAKLSIEEAARTLRLEFLSKVSRQQDASRIALGHTCDDQAETVLMRFLRGSGISGLRAIPALRKINHCLLIRPLIEVWRKQIIEYLEARKVNYRIDASNLEDVYLRNKIRNSLLPLLEKEFNPNIKEVLVNFAANITDDADFLEKLSEKKYRCACAQKTGTKATLYTKKLFALDIALQKMVARYAIREIKGDTRRIDYRHWKEIEDLALNRPKNSIVDLPGDVSVLKADKRLIFYKRSKQIAT